ncbi:MAG: alanine racemase [Gammaproteobacteria bacterium]|nr:alanine racemase [Gammaproteobacteria bacterium]
MAVDSRAWITIDRAALTHNLGVVRSYVPQAKIACAVKANGYGHGVAVTTSALEQADAFAVATLDEGLELRRLGLTHPVVLLEGITSDEEGRVAQAHGLQQVVHARYQLQILQQLPPSAPIPVWLKVDSGMHRLGFDPEEMAPLWREVEATPQLQLQGVMTHLADADDLHSSHTREQCARFERAVEMIPGPRSIANSAAILHWPQSHRHWVRPGIMLYGASPMGQGCGSDYRLRPAMTFSSRLIALREIAAGDCVGYGSTWCAPRRMRIGTVAVGYGDGYPRHAGNGTPLLVNGERTSLLGRVSMDMITIDLDHLPQAAVGDIVVLWGDGLAVEEVARAAGTIPYDLFCGITSRVSRVG